MRSPDSMRSGAASTASAAISAWATRSLSQVRRKLAIEGRKIRISPSMTKRMVSNSTLPDSPLKQARPFWSALGGASCGAPIIGRSSKSGLVFALIHACASSLLNFHRFLRLANAAGVAVQVPSSMSPDPRSRNLASAALLRQFCAPRFSPKIDFARRLSPYSAPPFRSE